MRHGLRGGYAWTAGLYLAARSPREPSDRAAFLDKFVGTDRFVLDLLGSEVLATQPPDRRSRPSRMAGRSPVGASLTARAGYPPTGGCTSQSGPGKIRRSRPSSNRTR